MGKSVAGITVNFTAGVSQFVSDVDRAQAKLKEFGGAHRTTVSDVQATSAALRVLEGNLANNLRAAERFAASLPGVGAALQAAFPVVGVVALLGTLAELPKKAQEAIDAFNKMAEAPQRIASAFASLNTSAALTNDELRVTNDRLENQIAKLDHKPQNTLKLALDEARLASDKLAESLEKTFSEIQKTLEATKISPLARLMGESGGGDLDQLIGGKSGAGGVTGRIAQIYSDYAEKIRSANTEQAKSLLYKQRDADLNGVLADTLGKVNAEIDKLNRLQAAGRNRVVNQNSPYGGVGPAVSAPSEMKYGEELGRLQGVRQRIEAAMDLGSLTIQNSQDRSRLAALKASPAQEKGPLESDLLSKMGDKILEERLKKTREYQEKYDAAVRSLSSRAQHKTIDEAINDMLDQDFAIGGNKKTLEDAARDYKRQSDLVNKLQGIGYLSNAAFGSRADKQSAARANYVATHLMDMSEADRQAAIKDYDANQALENKKAGIGMSARDGYKDFFEKMNDNTKSAGQQVEDVLGGAFNSVGQSITSMIEGGKVSWSGFFRSIASSFASAGLNQIFGLLSGGALSLLGGGGAGSALGSLFGGARAGGGPVSGGSAYVVGERGPELFVPGASGAIVPNHALAGGGGGPTYVIDARGTDPNLTEKNVRNAIVAAHASSVQTSLAASSEMRRRQPR